MDYLGIDRTINCTKCGKPGVCRYEFHGKIRVGRVCPGCFLKGLDELMVRSEIESGGYTSGREDGSIPTTPPSDPIMRDPN